MELLERKDSLDVLLRLANDVTAGDGRIVLLTGEAGVGKTSLLKHFNNQLNGETEILWGGCDALFTPRPLGPLYDIAYQIKSDLIKLLENEDKSVTIFSSFLNYLMSAPSLKIIIIEDIHWADEATLDLIKFLSRRIGRTHSILILSFRDEEINRNNQLQSLLGNLPHSETKRLRLFPLSEKAVDHLMKMAGIEIENLFEKTGGNPFFVSEVLANKDEEVPSGIKEAVIAHTSKLSEKTRQLLQLISVIPSKVEIELINKIFDNAEEHIDYCIDKAILVTEKNLISFRHELSRLAILNSIPKMKRRQLHQKVLDCILDSKHQQAQYARIVHHAGLADNKNVIIKYAPLAARQASMLSSHREAAANYLIAIEYSSDLPARVRLELYEARHNECYLTAQYTEAVKACEKIQELLEHLGYPLQLGENHRKLSLLFSELGDDEKSVFHIEKAIEILEELSPGRELAMAYSTRSLIYAASEDPYLSIKYAEKALNLAKKVDDEQIKIYALLNIGVGKMYVHNHEGEGSLKESLRLALQKGFDGDASVAYIHLGLCNLSRRNYKRAHGYFMEGISFCHEKVLDINRLNMLGGVAKIALDKGDWEEASKTAEYVLKHESVNPLDKRIAFAVIGLIRARRSDPEALINFDKAIPEPQVKGECAFIAKMAKAEAYWLVNRLDEVIDEIESNNLHLMNTNNPWKMGELAFWLWRGGRLPEVPENIARPYFLQIKGYWKEAAEEWKKLNTPYQEALALADGDEESKRKALGILEGLGATGTLNLLKQQMRDIGIKKIPKGPRKTTKRNPEGLTIRQMDVLELLTQHLSNSEIADKLFISPKTVDHHISAILAKLNLSSRTQAAAFAQSIKMHKE